MLDLSMALHADVASPSITLHLTNACDNRSFERDQQEIVARARSEGVCFLTKTLPSYGKALDKALSLNTPLNIMGLKKAPGTNLPIFLGRLWANVFDADGCERSDAHVESLRSLRQFLYLFYRYELPCSQDLHENVIQTFKQVDEDIGVEPLLESSDNEWLHLARGFTSRVFASHNHMDIRPRHGPGSVSTKEKAQEKKYFKRWYRNIAVVYPYEEYFHYNLSHLCDRLDCYLGLEELDIGTAKVVLVPKDSRGPRLISCEPLEYQWIQQGLGRSIMERLECHRLTKGHVNFVDQTVNRGLALEGSRTGKYATLDMKDASDRVSVWLVQRLFGDLPLMDALYATRSGYTRLPDGSIVCLNKFAPMGSALCFPVESFVFYALCVSALVHSKGYSWAKARGSVWVYGDDIICHIEDHDVLQAYLPKVKLMFNSSKCCTGKSFRESCGCDAFKGVDITPTKIRTVWNRQGSPECLMSYCSYQNDLYIKHYRIASEVLRARLLAVARLPHKSDVSQPYMGLMSDEVKSSQNLYGFKTRMNNTNRDVRKPVYEKYQVKCLKPRNLCIEDADLGWCEMLRVSSQRSLFTVAGRYPSVGRVSLKPAWCDVRP